MASAIGLMDAIDEPELARLLRTAEGLIRDQASRSGLDVKSRNPPDGPWRDFLEQVRRRLAQINDRLMDLFFGDGEDAMARLYAKTVAYVRENRVLFSNPG